MSKVNQSKFGRNGEIKVTMSMRSRGASATMSPGSRGAADIIAKFPSGTTWAIQVKRTRSGTAATPSPKDIGRLKNSASHRGATAVYRQNITARSGIYIGAHRSQTDAAKPKTLMAHDSKKPRFRIGCKNGI